MVNCQLPNANNSVENGIIYIAELLISYFCDQSDAYILQRDNITIARNIVAQVSFKNCAPFIKCITKIDRKTIHDAENLDLVIPIIISQNTARITLAQQVVYGFILKMKQLFLTLISGVLIILSLSNIKLN